MEEDLDSWLSVEVGEIANVRKSPKLRQYPIFKLTCACNP